MSKRRTLFWNPGFPNHVYYQNANSQWHIYYTQILFPWCFIKIAQNDGGNKFKSFNFVPPLCLGDMIRKKQVLSQSTKARQILTKFNTINNSAVFQCCMFTFTERYVDSTYIHAGPCSNHSSKSKNFENWQIDLYLNFGFPQWSEGGFY